MTQSLDEAVKRAQLVKAKYEIDLLRKKNVVGVGIGIKNIEGDDIVAIMVNVTHKVSWQKLAEEDRIPKMLDDIPVDVIVVGKIQAF